MKFVVLCGGSGTRLAQSNGFPKPWNFILGIPMLQYVLENIPSEDVTLILNKDLAYLNLDTTLHHCVKKRFQYIYLERPTRGALESAYLGIQRAGFSEDESICFLDNDTVYDLRETTLPHGKSFIGYSTTTEKGNPYCYITVENGRLTSVSEKKQTSQDYACGLYGFSNVRTFLTTAKETLMQRSDAREYYMSEIYRRMQDVSCVKINSPICLGTPDEIVRNKDRLPFHPLRICFDIDNTILKYRKPNQSYKECEPIEPMVTYLKQLKELGHTIILYTARGMATQKNDLGRVMSTIASDTFESLQTHGIPYDEIYFGKPHANIYIDDRAFNPYIQAREAMGFSYGCQESTQKEQASNKFNQIVRRGTTIEKIGPTSSMKGEVFFYQSVQDSLFPRYLGSKIDGDTTHLYLEHVGGSTLYEIMNDGLLSTHDVENVVDSLHRLHSYPLDVTITKDQVYENYIGKLRTRIQNKKDYPFANASDIVDTIDVGIRNYLFRQQTQLASVVHGDPWFSNTMLRNNSVVFLDMKGDIAGTLTTNGDPLTDFGKIYQSLLGFDFIVNNRDPIPMTELTAVFLQKVQALGFSLQDLNVVTACLVAKTLSFMDTDIEIRTRVWSIVESLTKLTNEHL
jgi:capsule biosynthesis phosphatase